MDWNVFFKVITWLLVIPAAVMTLVGYWAWLYDVDHAGKTALIAAIVFIIGAATIGGMGWLPAS